MAHTKRSVSRFEIGPPMLSDYPQTSLLGLPAELRTMIWSDITEGPFRPNDLKLLLTCRLFYHELCLPMFANTTFDMTGSGKYRGTNTRLHTQARSTLNQMPLAMKQNIKSLRTYASAPWLMEMLSKQAIALDRLEVAGDVDPVKNQMFVTWKRFNRFQLMVQDMLNYKPAIDELVLAADNAVNLETVHGAFVDRRNYLTSICNYDVDETMTEMVQENLMRSHFVVRLKDANAKGRCFTISQTKYVGQ